MFELRKHWPPRHLIPTRCGGPKGFNARIVEIGERTVSSLKGMVGISTNKAETGCHCAKFRKLFRSCFEIGTSVLMTC